MTKWTSNPKNSKWDLIRIENMELCEPFFNDVKALNPEHILKLEYQRSNNLNINAVTQGLNIKNFEEIEE